MAHLTEEFIAEFVPTGFDVFVETGTFLGKTIDNLKTRFTELHSIELSEKYYNLATEKFKNDRHIKIYKGSSPTVLKDMLTGYMLAKLVFWLDAHWSAADTAKGDIECPLLEELEAIRFSQFVSPPVIFIDDIRIFCKAPPEPYKPDEWCSLSEVYRSLLKINKDYIITVKEDMLVARL